MKKKIIIHICDSINKLKQQHATICDAQKIISQKNTQEALKINTDLDPIKREIYDKILKNHKQFKECFIDIFNAYLENNKQSFDSIEFDYFKDLIDEVSIEHNTNTLQLIFLEINSNPSFKSIKISND